MIGFPCSLPIFIAPAALARLGHPDGEMNFARAAWAEDIVMCVCLRQKQISPQGVDFVKAVK